MFQMYVEFEQKLTPAQRALVRTISNIALGSLTTAVLTLLTFMTSYPQLTLPVLVIGLFKTFIDAFGQGLIKYFTANGDVTAATITEDIVKISDQKLPKDLTPDVAVGQLPTLENK